MGKDDFTTPNDVGYDPTVTNKKSLSAVAALATAAKTTSDGSAITIAAGTKLMEVRAKAQVDLWVMVAVGDAITAELRN